MHRLLPIVLAFFLGLALCEAQVPYRETVPDVRYSVGGEKKPSRLSDDDALFTILAFEDENAPRNELPVWYTDEAIQPYFQNYNPDYGRTLFVVSGIKNKKSIARKLGVSSYPEYILVGPDRRILTRSNKAEDIIEYVTTNLSAYAETDWAAYLLKAKDLFDAGQVFAARRIVSDCLRHVRWDENFPPEVHKAIPRIVATMKDDDMYMDFVGEIKHKYNLGILSDEDVAPFRNEFSIIHLSSDKVSANARVKAPGDLLDKSDFETEIDGKPVSLYTITNGRISAQITNYGGYIVGIYTPDRNGEYTNVVGHNDNIQQYQTFSRNPVGSSLGRYANRIGYATFTLDGVKYDVTKNNGEHTLHGGRNGFDHTVWDVEAVNEDSVVLSCVLADGMDGFPGNLKTFLTFSITGDDGVSIDYRATTDKPTVCNLSHHVYFNLDGFPAENVLNHIVWINADAITEVDNALIPTGRLLPVEGTPYDFRSPTALGVRQIAAPAGRGAFGPGAPAPEIPEGMVRSFDQNFCLNHSVEGQVEKVASVCSPASGRMMEVFSDQPGLQFFTGNRLAFAMESQLYPDTLNRPEFPGKAVLRPGETYHHTVIYKFSKTE